MMRLRNGKTISNVESSVKMTPVKHTPKEEHSQSNGEITMRLRNRKIVTNSKTIVAENHCKRYYIRLLNELLIIHHDEAKKPNNFSNVMTTLTNILDVTAKFLSVLALSPSNESHLRFADTITYKSIVWLDEITNHGIRYPFDAELKTKIRNLCDKIMVVQMRILTFHLKKDVFENKTEIIQKKINKLCV